MNQATLSWENSQHYHGFSLEIPENFLKQLLKDWAQLLSMLLGITVIDTNKLMRVI